MTDTTPNPTAEHLRELVANLIPLDLIHDRQRPGQPQDAFEAADGIIAALRAHNLLSEGAPSEEQIERDTEALRAEIHEAWEFQYDECDHGVYSGGHMNGEPYAMCELTAERIVRRRAQALTAAGVAQPVLDPEKVAEMIWDYVDVSPEQQELLTRAFCEAAKRGELT